MNSSLVDTNEYYSEKEGYSYSDEQVDRWLKRWFVPYVELRPGSKVLDLCCGDGVWSFGLLRLQPDLEIVGVDIASSAIDCATNRAESEVASGKAVFRCEDVQEELNLPLGGYDLIFARGLFVFNQHNMMRPATLRLLEYWHALLREDGVFYASYGSKPKLLGQYTPPGKTKLPLNFVPRRAHSVDFRGGKYNHTVDTFLQPFIALLSVRVQQAVFLSGRHVLVTERRQVNPGDDRLDVRALCRKSTSEDRFEMGGDELGMERPSLTLIVPDTHFIEGEELNLQVYPPLQERYEIEMRGKLIKDVKKLSQNELSIKGLGRGRYRFRARCYREEASEWSLPLDITFHKPKEKALVGKMRSLQHEQALICEKDVNGVVVVTDPMAQPPSCLGGAKNSWFRTACYEGSTMLLNEASDYYRDPLKYYIDIIDTAKARGARFVTWSDVLAGRFDPKKCNLLLQYDVDAGPQSMARILKLLLEREVCATVMLHREAFDWYDYTVEDMDIDLLKTAERHGFDIGYHNNSLSNVQRKDRVGDYSRSLLDEATIRFSEDVKHLRQYFDIRFFTHHGGNSLNLKTPVPGDVDIVCVDKPFNGELWKKIKSSFSDGGFLSRPCSFREKIESCGKGVFFVRNHPVKYANYRSPIEILPSQPGDAIASGYELNREFWEKHDGEAGKQRKWLLHRRQHRLARRFSYASEHKPISRGFSEFSYVEKRVAKFRGFRRPTFLRQYPSAMGDPRVFWWRMLESYAPLQGEILNVGALPAGQKDELSEFLADAVKISDMDIDVERDPTFLSDVTSVGPELDGCFDGVLLFGLPYVHSPSVAIESCLRMTKPGGVALFGFASDTHPFRGGLWKPETRPVFRKAQEPLENIGLKGNLWSFDRQSVRELFPERDGVEVSIEFFSHYWFVICEK